MEAAERNLVLERSLRALAARWRKNDRYGVRTQAADELEAVLDGRYVAPHEPEQKHAIDCAQGPDCTCGVGLRDHRNRPAPSPL